MTRAHRFPAGFNDSLACFARFFLPRQTPAEHEALTEGAIVEMASWGLGRGFCLWGGARSLALLSVPPHVLLASPSPAILLCGSG